MASRGMPKTTQVASSWAMVIPPSSRISRRPSAPSSSMPVSRTPSAGSGGLRRGTKKDVHARSKPIDRRPLGEFDFATVSRASNQAVEIAGNDADDSALDRVAVFGFDHARGDRRIVVESGGEGGGEVLRQVLDDHHAGAILRDRGEQAMKRLHAAGARADDHDRLGRRAARIERPPRQNGVGTVFRLARDEHAGIAARGWSWTEDELSALAREKARTAFFTASISREVHASSSSAEVQFGLGMTSSAPSSKPVKPRSTWLVQRITGKGCWRMSLRRNVNPSILGISTSKTMARGTTFLMTSTAS